MKVSYKWLQEYFDEKLPAPEELGELLTFHAYEVEEVEKVNDDHVLDIDVLPNRSSDSLSHIGIAREIATLLSRKLKYDPFQEKVERYKESKEFTAEVEDSELCPRIAFVAIEKVKIGPSPDWLKEKLEVLGQRSINNIVDATNYVMLNLGKPIHAYDAEKLKGGNHKKIVVRSAQQGEKVTTLSDETFEVDDKTILIAGGVSGEPLGLAGVKGGNYAEVDDNTVDVLIEIGHFDPVRVRKTAQKLKLWTDASVRNQNNPSPDLIPFALKEVTELVLNIAGGEIEGEVYIDKVSPETKTVSVTVPQINRLLGTSLKKEEVASILGRLSFEYEENGDEFVVTPPFYRTDINIHEDLIEEVGRVHGYEHLEATPLPSIDANISINKEFYYSDKVRNILTSLGFSEVYGYTFRNKGDFEAITALASDKSFLRTNLEDGMRESLDTNDKNAPLFGAERVKLFEIGRVFPREGEFVSLTLGVSGKKTDKILNEAKEKLESELSCKIKENPQSGVLEINFTKLIESLPEGDKYEDFEKNLTQFSPISQYPFILRDIAVWVPSEAGEKDILDVVKSHAGELLKLHTKFDEFEKDGKTSYAYHLVFQSMERTLTDDEIGKIMDGITSDLDKKEGFEVR